MKRVWCSMGMLGLMVAALSSCYPGEISNTGETDLVVTGARPDYAFNQKTYFMPDTVFYIQSDTLAPDTFSHAYDADILSAVEDGLADYGYTPVSSAGAADVLVLNAIAVNLNLSVYTWYPGWWGGYWPCCYGGWYPWYPVTSASVWRSGTVMTTIVDPDLYQNGDDNGAVWLGLMNGLAEGSSESIRARILSGINQSFEQSPYLAGGSN